MNDLFLLILVIISIIVAAIYFFEVKNRNLSTNFLDFVKELAVIGSTMIFIVCAVFYIQQYQESGKKKMDSTNKTLSSLSDAEFTMYEDTDVSGSEVLTLIKRYNGEIAIIVTISAVNGSNTTSTCYCRGITYIDGVASYNDSVPLGKLSDAKDITKTYQYINPTKQYSGSVLRDVQNNVAGLHFELNY